jgi:uncharacterized protein (TIGR03083 family)
MPIDFLGHVRTESGRFAEVLAAADPSARVPSCPDWTAADLLWHLAEVQLFWAAIVRERADNPSQLDLEPQRPSDYGELQRYFAECSRGLIDALENATDDVAVWTWFDADQSVGFVRRRQAHEALIHRLDAELVTGAVTAFDADLATDGVLEVLEWMYSEIPSWATHELDDGLGRIATTDTGAQWRVRTGELRGTDPDSGAEVVHPTLTLVPDGEPTFEISGTARDLDAWLWNRPTLTDVTRTGDAQRFEQIIRGGVQ